VATIVLRPVANQVTLTQEGKAGVELSVVRMADTDLLDASSILEGWVEKTRATLSPGTEIYLYSEAKKFMLDMTNIILRNGLSGLCLVILVLYVFLNGRVAWWVMIGIPVSFMGAFALYLLVGDGSLNSVMMIALVMSIGIVVDDAIVVGEDTLTFHEAGYSAADAAVAGAGRMFSPVIASSATTAAAFIPVIIVAWQEPVIMILPLTVVCVILASLAECFLVLPGHLRHSYEVMKAGRVDSFRNRFDTAFKDFRDNKFKPLLHWALTNRAATLAVAISALAIALSLLASGRVSINLTTGLNFEYAEANIQFNSGATQAVRENYLRQLEESLKQADQQFEDAAFVTFITRHNYARLGEDRKAGEEFASLFVELTPPEDRAFTNEEFAAEWRKLAPVSAYVTSAQIEAMGGRRKGGPELTLTLRGNDVGTLKLAAEELEEVLSRYPGVTNVFDNLPYGKEQWILSMTIEGRALGLSVESIGRQLRAAYDGERVQIFNGRYDELEVRLMLPEAERQSLTSLKTFPIMTEQGEMIPMATVATIASRKGIDIIKHWKTQQMVSVSANVDTTINTSGRILADLEKAELKQILAKYNLDYGLGGRSAEEAKMLSMMGLGALLGLVLIYIVLVWVFASYTWPLAIMTAIPLGITGAIAGHWIMGMHISAMSMLAVFTLTGVVVNDSIVLISFYKEKRAEGLPVQQCLLEASCERLRAIVLTSLTTIVGLSPLIFESAPIASYLIPLAVTMVFGMGYASVLVLFVIPTLLSAIESMNVERARWIGRMMVRLLPESANA
jgi:multidrug efflux pump subunit AcrB